MSDAPRGERPAPETPKGDAEPARTGAEVVASDLEHNGD